MRIALRLARRNLGRTWPNPSVGALVVREEQILSQSYTAKSGRPHAEPQALAMAGSAARGATLYVTLEPCCHHGKTPPCTDAIIAAGIRRVVIACPDPNPLVGGKGLAQLRQAGIEVVEQVCTPEAKMVNEGFFSVQQKARPFVSVKLATSLDGKVATRSGESQWITGESARRHGQALRSHYDAIATGIGTVLADDPLLTCRLPGLEDRSPVRIVFDSDGRLPLDSQLVKTARAVPTWLLSSRRRPGSIPLHALEGKGIKCLNDQTSNDLDPGLHRDDEERVNLTTTMQVLAREGVTRLLVEAGPRLTTAFLQQGLVDRVYWFRAPFVIGGDGLEVAKGGFSAALSQLPRWKLVERKSIAPDTLEIFECSPVS